MYKTLNKIDLEIFTIDMELYGFDADTTADEIERLETCATVEDYIRASRVGATVRLTRAERKEVFALYSLWIAKEVA